MAIVKGNPGFFAKCENLGFDRIRNVHLVSTSSYSFQLHLGRTWVSSGYSHARPVYGIACLLRRIPHRNGAIIIGPRFRKVSEKGVHMSALHETGRACRVELDHAGVLG